MKLNNTKLKSNEQQLTPFSWSFGVVLYELLSFGAQPYAQIANANELIDYLCSGRRLPKPEMITDDDDKM